ATGGGVDVQNVAVQVLDKGGIRGPFEQVPETLFAFAEHGLRLLLPRDVADDQKPQGPGFRVDPAHADVDGPAAAFGRSQALVGGDVVLGRLTGVHQFRQVVARGAFHQVVQGQGEQLLAAQAGQALGGRVGVQDAQVGGVEDEEGVVGLAEDAAVNLAVLVRG